MKILAIETSCDETSAAVVEDGKRVLSNIVKSQIDTHKIFGGVVPEIASRKHIELILPVVTKALNEAGIKKEDIDAVAVTAYPGLVGALLVGVNFAKAFAFSLGVPIIPVHHIRAHIAANYLEYNNLAPEFLGFVVSGGHTHLMRISDYTNFEILGRTRDDAAGECFDKVARVLGLSYPGGVEIDKLWKEGKKEDIKFPKAMIDGHPLDFSFSGVKTFAVNYIHNKQQKGEEIDKAAFAGTFNDAVAEALVSRLILASHQTGIKTVAIAGGVAANSAFRKLAEKECKKNGITLYIPSLSLCGDNAAMVGTQGYFEYLKGNIADCALNAQASCSVEMKKDIM